MIRRVGSPPVGIDHSYLFHHSILYPLRSGRGTRDYDIRRTTDRDRLGFAFRLVAFQAHQAAGHAVAAPQ